MNQPPPDLLRSLLELVQAAARDGAGEALKAYQGSSPVAPTPLLDKKALSHALGVSLASVDRLCRDGRIPFVSVGDVRRFDFAAVLAALDGGGPATPPTTKPARTMPREVRLLSRGSR
jgi:excisionase family DNA binding protein